MSKEEHPYAGPNTLTPGDTMGDDPFVDEEYCQTCDKYVELVADTCPVCGQEVE